MRIKHLLLLITIIQFNPSYSATSVGTAPLGTPPGVGRCNYSTIQAALDSGATAISVLNDQEFDENLVISQSVSIEGGHASCTTANLNLAPTATNTIING